MIDAVFRRRRNAYGRLFKLQDGRPVGDSRLVLADLKRFARLPDAPLVRASGSGNADPLATGVMIGRQEVVNRILAHLHLSDAAFFNLKEPIDE